MKFSTLLSSISLQFWFFIFKIWKVTWKGPFSFGWSYFDLIPKNLPLTKFAMVYIIKSRIFILVRPLAYWTLDQI